MLANLKTLLMSVLAVVFLSQVAWGQTPTALLPKNELLSLYQDEDGIEREVQQLHKGQLLDLAKGGDAEARFLLHSLYGSENSVFGFDGGKSEHWLHAAAEAGHVEAMLLTGLYAFTSSKENFFNAQKWLLVASAIGNEEQAVRANQNLNNMLVFTPLERQKEIRAGAAQWLTQRGSKIPDLWACYGRDNFSECWVGLINCLTAAGSNEAMRAVCIHEIQP
ncbi:hypothetical protein [Aestuariispira insulae]|uniref:Sel1 repeat-containing protein n=1 Tax=Aestuariispira insulae TaxID=1461337 RepID=A0A3D9HRG7_9PROT|nr:hypothetical protein [Aestuariispira insulae]RED52070.1 hypothetical protein DFP90_10288 [Aestuariispira insulae]